MCHIELMYYSIPPMGNVQPAAELEDTGGFHIFLCSMVTNSISQELVKGQYFAHGDEPCTLSRR